MSKCKKVLMTQPEEWIEAAKIQAAREGSSLSAWIGECILANLDKDLSRSLPDRPKASRPSASKPAKESNR
jgi:hypothetical protein